MLTRQGGLQVLQQAGVVFVLGAAGDAIAEFFAGDIAAGIHGLNGMVSAGGLAVETFGAGDFVQVAVAVVVVLGAVVQIAVAGSGGVKHLVGAAISVVGDFFVMATQCACYSEACGCFGESAEAVIFWHFDITAEKVFNIVQLTATIGGGVIGPDGVGFLGAVGQFVGTGF